MPVELTCRAVSGRPYADALRADALTLLEILALEHCELSLMLVSDSAIRRLNRKFRAKDQPTDVLSFPNAQSTAFLGEIAISAARARAQAAAIGHSLENEIRILMLHGLLHLLGMDHETDRGQMQRAEARWHKRLALPEGLIERRAGFSPRGTLVPRLRA